MATQLHADDLVANRDDETELGIVERTHADVDTHTPHPARNDPDPIRPDRGVSRKLFDKFLKDGIPPPKTVFVRWQNKENATITLESRLKVLDRTLLIGDVVRRHARDAMSGVVINASTRCVLQPIGDIEFPGPRGNNKLKGLLPPSPPDSEYVRYHHPTSGTPPQLVDIPASELRHSDAVNEEDLFVYKDRLGRIEELDHNITLKLQDNSVVEIHQDSAENFGTDVERYTVGDIASAKKPALRLGKWIFGKYNPNTQPIGTVVDTRIVSAEVTWLQRRIGAPETEDPPTTLDSDDFESSDFHIYDRTRLPRRSPTHGSSDTVSYSQSDLDLGDSVRFKDLAGACVKYDGSTHHGKLERLDRQDTLGYDINVFHVVKFRTDVTVQWQDLSITHDPSISLVPDGAIDDEHAAWPGEIAHTLDFADVPGQRGMTQPSRVGVVQTVNSAERMVTLRWSDEGQMQYFDDPEDGLEYRTLITGVVGRAAGELQELSLYDVEAPGSMNVRRGDTVLLMNEALERRDGEAAADDFDWVGEIVDTCLDGTLTVRLGAAKEVRDVNVRREHVHVAVRSDGTDQPDEWDQGESDEDMESGEEYESTDEYISRRRGGEEYGTPGDPGYLHPDNTDDEYDGFSDNEDDESVQATYEDENGEPLDEDEVEDEDWESDVSGDEDVDMIDAPAVTPPSSHSVTPPQPNDRTSDETDPPISAERTSSGPPSYLVLETEPTSHHYASEDSPVSANQMKRIQKEHKILRSADSLPSGVYVRTWESRMDLVRVLFVGPAETPYADVPFVIDFYLSGTFPREPPQAFFHNWTAETSLGGVGPVNPNLYEDGKICLSLLGTWEGGKSEGWNAARSTLLQVIVSILGLVLVREPYFNEAGYEPLAGLESSKRPSALYNERTYLRANSFLVRAIDWINSPEDDSGCASIDGVKDVVRWLYKDADGKKLLKRRIEDVEAILEKSEGSTAESDGLTSMSKGACIPLRRALARLKEL
ncbi:hypothetical protein LTR09_002489 [Extremus antarcticus]|uniref:UBC core domain-containing protein n=1 Tax=Extremus antarcticus TaxID=702011 RepID=A0AAJ0LVH2_9PEZI|nr:hypothetical protein LTR09_002489 [Extremus antarcticus]